MMRVAKHLNIIILTIDMTLGLALVYAKGVVLGSDTQATYQGTNVKQRETKLERLGDYVGIVGSGDMDFYKDMVRRLRKHRKTIDSSSIPDVADLVSETMANLYELYRERFGKAEIEDVVPLAPLEGVLVAGVGKDKKPHVFQVSPPGIIGPRDDFGIIGSALPYANMVLSIWYRPQQDSDQTARLVLRTIREAAQVDPYVSGIQLAAIDPTVFPNNLLPPARRSPFVRFGRLRIGHYLDEIVAEDEAMGLVVGSITEKMVPPGLEEATKNLKNASDAFKAKYLAFLQGSDEGS